MSLSVSPVVYTGVLNIALNRSLSNLYEAVERLSTGERINSAADDPAGMAMSQLMRAQSATYTQAIRNSQDAISLLQTAESGLNEIDENLVRMKELAEQAATGSYTDAQRLIMQSEFELMGTEIDRIAGSTSYNTFKLLDGSLASSATWSSAGGWTEPDGGMRIQVGDGALRAEDYYYITIPDTRTTALLNSQTVAISTQAAAAAALDILNTAIINKENAIGWVGALENRLESTLDNLEGQVAALDNAEANITDADIAAETANYVASLILTQSGIAMIAQANSIPQLVLQLIGMD
ncbi:MAG: flagellin [Candidatus Cloacimonetes bacterium]|nr:flagellin [Candidatus Cloacimonadota bacterium]